MKKLLAVSLVLLLLLPLAALATAPVFTVGVNLPQATQGVYYSTQITATGANPITFYLEPGDNEVDRSIPRGMDMNPQGLIYGTPQRAGTYRITINAEDLTASTETAAVFTLTVKAAGQGGQSSQSPAAPAAPGVYPGEDDLTGVANAPNGGQAAMGLGKLFFVQGRGYLMESTPPFSKAQRTYRTLEYNWLDALGSDLYYFNRYLAEEGKLITPVPMPVRPSDPGRKTEDRYEMRILQDSIDVKGRIELTRLTGRINNLSVTHQLVLCLQNGRLQRVDIASHRRTVLQAKLQGREIKAASTFPYNGYGYFAGAKDGRLYRMHLDSQAVEPLTTEKVGAYTVGMWQGEPALYYTNSRKQLHRAGLDGSAPQLVEGIKAEALNADNTHVYFANPQDGYKVYRMDPSSDVAVVVSKTGAKGIYVFDEYLAFHPRTGKDLIVISKEGGREARLKR